MKNFGGIKTRYLLDGTNIIAQEVTNGDSLDYFYFFYDASGNILQMNDTTDGWFKVAPQTRSAIAVTTTLAMHGCGMELERRKEVYCEKIDSFMERTRLSFSI